MRQATISELTEFLSDGTHGSPERTETGVPVLSAQHVNGGGLSYNTDRFTTVNEYEAFRRRVELRTDDVLLTIVGSIGRSAVVNEPLPAVLQRSIAIIRPKRDQLDSRYLFHVTQSQAFQAQLTKYSNQSAQAGIYLGKLGKVTVAVPPLDEQRRIAAILDKADALRSKRRHAIALLDSLTQSIFLEMFGDLCQWPVVTFENVLCQKLRNGVSPSSEGTVEFPVLTLSAVTGARFNATACKLGMFKVAPGMYQRVDVRDFMICRGNGNKRLVGKGAFPPRDMIDTAFPDTIIAGRINSEAIDKCYLASIWSHEIIRRQIEAQARTTNGTFKVNQGILEQIQLPLPDRSLQRTFAARITEAGSVASDMNTSLEAIGVVFASLQHSAFSGQL